MKMIPAIDLLDGEVVRLSRGDYNEVSKYSTSPLQVALKLKNHHFSFIHIVDLSGARAGKPVHKEIVKQIIDSGLQVQVGGGIRTPADVDFYLSAGAARVILGTQAIRQPEFWQEMVQKYGKDRVVLSLDLKGDAVAIEGWLHSSNLTLLEVLNLLGKDSVKNLIVTDVARDGMMSGVNIPFYKAIREKAPGINLIPAGGFTSLKDYEGLKEIGCREAIVGKAIYENDSLLKQIQGKQSCHCN